MVLNVQTQEILKRGIKKIRTICDSPILNNVEKIISDESFDLESLKLLQSQGRRLRRTGCTPIDDDNGFVAISRHQGVFG